MLRAFFRSLFPRPADRLDRRARNLRLRRAQFESFVAASGCLPPRKLGAYDARLRRTRLARRLVLAALAVLGSWFALESAHALARF